MAAQQSQGELTSYVTESVYKFVLQKSADPQIRQLILYNSNSQGQVDGFVGELSSAKKSFKTLCIRSTLSAKPRWAVSPAPPLHNIAAQQTQGELISQNVFVHEF